MTGPYETGATCGQKYVTDVKQDAKLMSVDIEFIYLGVQRKYLLLMFDNHQTQG